eukprot:6205749-Pleurochrysis_carterae.AAC.1
MAQSPHLPQETSFGVFVQDHEALSTAVNIVPEPAGHLSAVLCTKQLFVDRSLAKVVFQLQSVSGSVYVSFSSHIRIQMRVATEDAFKTFACDTRAAGDFNNHFLGHCTGLIPKSWFSSVAPEREANVSIFLWVENTLEYMKEVGTITLSPATDWWGREALTLSSAGVYATLPVAPVFPGDVFVVQIFANAGEHEIEAFKVQVAYDISNAAFKSFVQSTHYNTPVLSHDFTRGRLQISSVGKSALASSANVQGASVFLGEVHILVRNTIPEHVASTTILVRCIELVNPGLVKFKGNSSAVVLDYRLGVENSIGEVKIRRASPVGLLAYVPSVVMTNFAHITGQPQSTVITTVHVTNDDRLALPVAATAGASCSRTNSSLAFYLIGCTIQLTAQNEGNATDETVLVQYGNLTTQLLLSVSTPSSVKIVPGQSTLNRVADSSLNAIICDNSPMYQTTTLSVYAGSFDVTFLASFRVANISVLSVQGPHGSPIVVGISLGVTTVQLAGSVSEASSTEISVTDHLVQAVSLIARVVTAVNWEQANTPSESDAIPNLLLAGTVMQRLRAEGASGLLYASIQWADGLVQALTSDSSFAQAQLNVTSTSASIGLEPPGADALLPDHRWKVSVAYAAMPGCLLNSLFVEYRACGALVATGYAPVHLDLPSPTHLEVTADVEDLAPPGDDATALPISIPSSTRLTVTTFYDDGAEQIMTGDTRISLSLSSSQDAACATITKNVVQVLPATNCSSIAIVAIYDGASLSASISLKVVRLSALQLTFLDASGHHIESVGLVQCTSAFHQAFAVASAFLSNGNSYPVTSHTTFASSNNSLVQVHQNRLASQAPGTAVITAVFAYSSMSNLSFEVAAEVIDPVAQVEWQIPLNEQNTLSLETDATVSTTASVRFASGLWYANLAQAASGWFNFDEMIEYKSSETDIVQVSPTGNLTLLDNWHHLVDLTARIRCGAGVLTSHSVKANLLPASGDVDLGFKFGFQFQQTLDGYLPLAVRIRVPDGAVLKSFQLNIDFAPELDTASLILR